MTLPSSQPRWRRRIFAAALLVLAKGLIPSLASTLPAGFVETDLVHITGSVAIEFDPSGLLWIAQSGTGEGMHVWVFDGVAPTLIHSFPGSITGERGLHNLTLDPDYATNGHVWIYRTVFDENPHNRVSRFTNHAALSLEKHDEFGLEDELIVWEGPPRLDVIHNGGCFVFASDKTIYLGAGDDNQGSATSQNPFDPRGKILHMNRDGSPADGNPFADGVAGDPLVWALGLRNPFRCSIQPETDNLFIADVGGSNWEEISIGVAGGNFGWAFVEGILPPGLPGFVYPIYTYPHDNPAGSAVVAGAHATVADFGSLYEGNFFFADWARGEIYRMVLEDNVQPVSTEVFMSGIGRPADLLFGPDGALYYAARGVNFVRRVEYVGGDNRQPVAIASATPGEGLAPLEATLDGSASFDPDEDTLTYAWDLGDGEVAATEVVVHAYESGVYAATLTVDDGQGLTATAPPVRIVSGNRAPMVTLDSPVQGLAYDAGDVVSFSATATDPEEGALGCAGYRWQVLFHHDNHSHPFLGPLQGICSGLFTVPVRGEASANVGYTVHVWTADSGQPIGPEASLEATKVVEIFPNKSTITLESDPIPGLTMTLGTIPFSAPQSTESVVGLIRTIGAPDQQTFAGQSWAWMGWSDAGARDHEVAAAAIDTTIVATFECELVSPIKQLTVEKGSTGMGEVVLRWAAVPEECLTGATPGYRIYSGADVRPETAEGQFPFDPDFQLVGSSVSSQFTYVPEVDHRFFLVAPVAMDETLGPLGHYGR